MLQVPASRADIFQNTDLSPSSKRNLMRFLKNTLDAIEGKGPLKASLSIFPAHQLITLSSIPITVSQIQANSHITLFGRPSRVLLYNLLGRSSE